MAVLTLTAGGVFRFARETNTALMLSTMFTNTGNYGLPLALFAFGQQGFEQAILFFVMQGILVHTLGIYLASSGQSGWRKGAASLLKMPQLYAVGAALALRWIGPEIVTASENIASDLFRGVSLMGDAAIPILLVLLGAELARAEIDTGDVSGISVAVVIRLFLAVPISYGLAYVLGLDPLPMRLAMVLGSMPTAVNVIVLALEFDLRPKLVSSIVIVSTVLSFVTLTVLLVVLRAY
jgi:predicted permease